jgi:hypothetical protein
MRRRRRRITRSHPPRPHRWFYSVETPFHMTYIVHRYGQPTQPQQLARVAQSRRAGRAALVLGEVAFDGPMGR